MTKERISRLSILIVFLTLMVSGIYLAYGPITGVAAACGSGECVYADKCYSSGACLGTMHCENGNWNQCKECCIQP